MTRTADGVIVGGGIIGGSVAYHLLERDPGLSVIHSPAIGLLMAELVLDGRASGLDIEPLSLARFAGALRAEANVF